MAVDAAGFAAKTKRVGEHVLWTGASTKSGAGVVRIGPTTSSATRVAWELENGPLPDGHRVRSCPDNKLCVLAAHLSTYEYRRKDGAKRRAKGGGSLREAGPGKWKLTVDAGRDKRGQRRRVSRTIRGSKSDASKALASMVVEVQQGERRPVDSSGALSVGELVDWYLTFARDVRGLERTTLFGYREVFDKWLAPHIGHVRADRLTPAQIDEVFGLMRAEGKSHGRMNNARSALAGAYKWGRRHDKVTANPMRGFEMPKSTHVPRQTVAPEPHELRNLLQQAETLDPEIAPVLVLAATTGMRRGELSGLRRDRLRLGRGELVVELAISEIDGELEEKPTKNHSRRTIRLDDSTVAYLRAHLAKMDARAASVDMTVAEDGYVFSIMPNCVTPMRPELMTRRMRQLRKKLGITASDFDATILAMRKWTSTELMDAGFNPSAVSGRQGHTVQVMLNHYSSRRTSADQAAADHLGAQVFTTPTTDED